MIVNRCILQDMTYYHNQTKSIDINAVGCELSEWEADEIAKVVIPNSIVLNTCAVTENIEHASILVAKLLRKIYPDRNFFITGCGVNYNEENFKDLNAILLPNEKKNNCKDIVYKNQIRRNNEEVGYIKVQEGCKNHCAYCVVNKLRSNLISTPYEEIKQQIKDHLANDMKALEIIGTEICLYNSDGLTIDTLCEKILNDFPAIEKLTLNALNPSSRKIENIIDLMAKDPRMEKILYLSVQSGSDTILNRMHRAYTAERIREICNYNKQVKTVWDLVCGFPGETEEQFNETVRLVNELKPMELMICPYSDREGTESSMLPDHLTKEEIMKRARILRFTSCGEYNEPVFQTKGKIVHLDLYDDEAVAQFCRENTSSNIVIRSEYRGFTEQFEVNCKVVSVRFGIHFEFINKSDEKIPNINDFLDYYNGNSIR